MSLLSPEARVRVISQLVEGCSIASTVRLTGVSKPTVLSLLVRMGEGCDRLHDRLVRELSCVHVEIDEIWSYIQKKQSRVTEGDPAEYGDAYTFVAMGSATRLVMAYRVGKRDQATTDAFIADLRARLVTVPQLSTDGFRPYPVAIGSNFPGVADYCVIHKEFKRGGRRDDDYRYEPPRNPFITKIPVFGAPDIAKATTSRVEKQNHTMRMHIRRMTRLSNGFSRKLANHRAAVALHFAYYNLCKIHEAHRVTPAMEAGITDHVWSVEELVTAALTEPAGDAPKRKPLRLPEPPAGVVAAPVRELPGGRGSSAWSPRGPRPRVRACRNRRRLRDRRPRPRPPARFSSACSTRGRPVRCRRRIHRSRGPCGSSHSLRMTSAARNGCALA